MLLPPVIGGTGLGGLAIDGGIVADPSPRDERMTVLEEQGLPAVTIGRDLGGPTIPGMWSWTIPRTPGWCSITWQSAGPGGSRS